MLSSILHVGLTVLDLDRSIAFYRDILGLHFIGRMTMDGEETARLFGRNGCRAEVAYLNGSDERHAPPVELICFTDAPSRPDRGDLFRTSISELCFLVGDIDGEYRRLSALGVEFLSPPQSFDSTAYGFGKSRAVYFRDPDGIILELLQPVEETPRVGQSVVPETPRLILRPWQPDDAPDLFRLAKDPTVGPACGWPPHRSIEESRHIIETVLSQPETYAVCLKKSLYGGVGGQPVGSIGLRFPDCAGMPDMEETACEIGFWIGVPFQGKGLMPEAIRVMLDRCFTSLARTAVYAGYFDGNEPSRRVQEACGFLPDGAYTGENPEKTIHKTVMTRERWEAGRKPQVHEMTLDSSPFSSVCSGRKTLEMRLFDRKRQKVRIGDRIRFTKRGTDAQATGTSVCVTVTGLQVFPDFPDLYGTLIPQMGKQALGYAETAVPSPSDMLTFYAQSDIARFGVVGMEIRKDND